MLNKSKGILIDRNYIKKSFLVILGFMILSIGVVFGDFSTKFTEVGNIIGEQLCPMFAQVWQASTGKVYNSCNDVDGNGDVDISELYLCNTGLSIESGTLSGVWLIDKLYDFGLDGWKENPDSGPNNNNGTKIPSMTELYDVSTLYMGIPQDTTELIHIASSDSIFWVWDDVLNASYYEWSTDNSTWIDKNTDLSHNETSLTCGTVQTAYIRACNEVGCSSGIILSSSTNECTTLSSPTAGAHAPTQTSITWAWNSVSGATYYNLLSGSNVIYSGSNLSYNDISLGCGTAYSRDIKACNTAVCSSATTLNSSTITCPPTAPTAGTHISTQTGITWVWNSVSVATGYRFSSGSDIYADAIDVGISTSYLVTGLLSGNMYTGYVWAYNSGGNSEVRTMTASTLGTCTAGSSVFTYNGSNQNFTVPSGCTSISVKAWGAGGGGGNPSRSQTANGGGGGFASGTLSVTPGESLTIVVGGGGNGSSLGGFGGGGNGVNLYGGGGGGRTSIMIGSDDILVAGGGGGGGYDYAGGAGGGTSGLRNVGDGGGGYGGTQSAGGTCGSSGYSNCDGILKNGGNGGYYAGAGGGGYYGGGGGGTVSGYGNGGGGGSSYYGTNGTTVAGNGQAVGNGSDADYISGVGVGGNGGTSSIGGNGGNGYMVIRWGGS